MLNNHKWALDGKFCSYIDLIGPSLPENLRIRQMYKFSCSFSQGEEKKLSYAQIIILYNFFSILQHRR